MNRISVWSLLFISMTAGVTGACAAPAATDDQTSAAAEHALDSLPLIDAKQYDITHHQDYSIYHFADLGKGLFPIVGNVGFPGGPDHVVAEAGKPLVIEYDRYINQYTASCPTSAMSDVFIIYPSCGEMSCGEPPPPCTIHNLYKKVQLHYQIARGPVQTVSIKLYPSDDGAASRVTIPIPPDASGDLAYWFELTRPDGSTEWDSKFGRNYHVDILTKPTATLSYTASWSNPVSGSIKAGETIRIAYDRKRLVDQLLRGTPYSPNPLHIEAFVSFDGGAPSVLPIDEDYGSLLQPIVRVPAGTRDVAVWFKGEADVTFLPAGASTPKQEHRIAYDSKFGANYHYSVSP